MSSVILNIASLTHARQVHAMTEYHGSAPTGGTQLESTPDHQNDDETVAGSGSGRATESQRNRGSCVGSAPQTDVYEWR